MSNSKLKQRVIYISDIDLALAKGPSVNELEFVDALLGDPNYDAEIIVPRPSGYVRSNVKSAIKEILPFPIRRKNIITLFLFEIVFLFYLLSERRRLKNARIITRISILPLGLFLGAPFVAGLFHLKTAGDGSFRYFQRLPCGAVFVWLHQFMYRRIMRFAHSADMVTKRHLEDFSRNIGFGDKLLVAPNRVNTDVFHLDNKNLLRQKFGFYKYDYVFGYVGNDPFHRGAKEAILALPYILREGVNAAVVIIGEMTGEEVSWIKENCATENIFLIGQIPYYSVPDYMNTFDVGVSFLPEWHRGASEQKVRQYLACGVVPVVTPGGSDFVGRDGVGFVCDNDDIPKLASVILHALKQSQELSVLCRKYAEEMLSHKLLLIDRMKAWE